MSVDKQVQHLGLECLDSLEYLDLNIYKRERYSLEDIAKAHHNISVAKNLLAHYNLELNDDKKNTLLKACGYNSFSELPELDESEIKAINRVINQSIQNSEPKNFDMLAMRIEIGYKTLIETKEIIKDEIEAFQKQQSNKFNELEEIYNARNQLITSKESKIKELKTKIYLEGLILFLAFIIGLLGGIWGVIIALIVALIWRSSS